MMIAQLTGLAGQARASTLESVSGTVTYRDANNQVRPVRGAVVQLMLGGVVQVWTRTETNGAFTLNAADLPSATYRVRVITVNPYGNIAHEQTLNTFEGFSAFMQINPGDNLTGIPVAPTAGSDANAAFALLDALYTVGGFYHSIRRPDWPSTLEVRYPYSGTSYSVPVPTPSIHIAPGDVFSWDVLAHEVGHFVSLYGGFTELFTWGAHAACTGTWGSGDKDDALELAWIEGFSDFFAVLATYDRAPTGIPSTGDELFRTHSLENRNDLSCPPSGGEDSELAIAAVLWDMVDRQGSYDEKLGWEFSDLLSRLENAGPETFSQALPVLLAERTTAETREVEKVLEIWGFTPRLTAPTDGVISNRPVDFTWTAGGANLHPHNSFTIRVEDADTGDFIGGATTSDTNYLPDPVTWRKMGEAGSIRVKLTGTQGSAPVTSYTSDRVLKIGDIPEVPRLMVVGDSISQGMEGDYTWRYRLKQHLAGAGQSVDFVGPHRGTRVVPPVHNGSAPYEGGYGPTNISFDSHHLSRWGWQAHQAKSEIRQETQAHQPDYLLIELGFNDLAWGVSSPEGLLNDIRSMVADARSSKSDVRILVANVVHRTPLGNLPNLNSTITYYNNLLASAVPTMNTPSSPVRLVDLASDYDPVQDAYDGLHPNGIGEYKIARRFANGLAALGVGPTFGTIPATVPDFRPAAPASLRVIATPAGITVEWDHSYGAHGYWLYSRNHGTGGQWQLGQIPIGADSFQASWVIKGWLYEYYVVPMRGELLGEPSPVGSAVANPQTAAAPTNIQVLPGATYIDLTWQPPTGDFSQSVSGYKVFWFDQTAAGAVIADRVVNTASARIENLVAGHRYSLAVSSINAAGEGFPSGAASAVVGYGVPATPVLLDVSLVNPVEATLTWTAVPGAAGYDIIGYRPGDGPYRMHVDQVTSYTAIWLFDGAVNITWCVVATNGSFTSGESNCIRRALDTPSLLDAEVTSRHEVTLSWTAVPHATGYRILSRNINTGGPFNPHFETPGTSVVMGYLFDGPGLYEWCVVALTYGGESAPSNCLRGRLAAPYLWDARIVESHGVILDWDGSLGTANYRVYGRDRVANPGGPFQSLGITTDTRLGVSALPSAADRWEWYIVAEGDGLVSPRSNILASNPAYHALL